MRIALRCSLMLVPMLTAGLPALAQRSGTGVGLVQLGQHSVDEIKDRQRQIKAELNRHGLAKVDREMLKAEWRRLDTESQGNVIVGAYLRRLDSVGQRNGLELGDITVSIDPRHDFTGFGLSREQVNRIRESITNAFVLNRGGPIYVPTESVLYRNSIGNIEFQDFGGVVLRHEQVHTQGGGEVQAYMVQRDIFQLFRADFQPGNFTNLDAQLQGSIERTPHE